MPGRTAPSSGVSAAPTCSIARGARAAAHAGLAATGFAAGGRGTTHCASSWYVETMGGGGGGFLDPLAPPNPLPPLLVCPYAGPRWGGS